MWLQRATIYQEITPWMHSLRSHQSALRDSGKGTPGDSQQKMSQYVSEPAFQWETELLGSRPKPQELGALDSGQQICNLPLFHKSSFSFFGASADPMGYSSPLVSATCPGRFSVSCPLLEVGCPKALCRAPGALDALRAVVAPVTLSSCSWRCLNSSESCGAFLSSPWDKILLSPCLRGLIWALFLTDTARGRLSRFWCKTGQENS